MQEGVVVSTAAGHYVRLALIFLASVFGLILLGFAFGSSSASADDGGPDDGGLVPAVAELVGDAVETVAPVATAPVSTVVAAAIPLDDVPLSPASTTIAAVTDVVPIAGAAIGSLPTAPVLDALVARIDTTVNSTIAAAVGTVIGTVGHALQVLPVLATTAAVGAAATASATDIVTGTAHALLLGAPGPFGTGGISASGPPLTGFTLPVAALGTGFLVLLFSRRLGLVNGTLPVSPVYETDTSPD
jgi:hypothetical protein